MRINLNQRDEDVSTEGLQCFGDLMNSLSRRAEQGGMSILQVKLNGEDVTGKDRINLNPLPLEEVHEVEIEMGDPRVLARSTLYSVVDFLEQLLGEIQRTAERFRLGFDDRSGQAFLRCIDGMQVFMHSLERCRRLLGLSFELLFTPSAQDGNEVTVAENRRRLFEVLDGMIEAQSNQDYILLADLMEYELLPILQDWRQIIPLILQKTESCDPNLMEYGEVDLRFREVLTQEV